MTSNALVEIEVLTGSGCGHCQSALGLVRRDPKNVKAIPTF